METEEARAKAESTFVTCKTCGDNILEDFLDRHMAMNHPAGSGEALPPSSGADEGGKGGSPPTNESINQSIQSINEGEATANGKDNSFARNRSLTRECPVCTQEMRSDQMIKHCKLAHKVSLKWCDLCGR